MRLRCPPSEFKCFLAGQTILSEIFSILYVKLSSVVYLCLRAQNFFFGGGGGGVGVGFSSLCTAISVFRCLLLFT